MTVGQVVTPVDTVVVDGALGFVLSGSVPVPPPRDLAPPVPYGLLPGPGGETEVDKSPTPDVRFRDMSGVRWEGSPYDRN